MLDRNPLYSTLPHNDSVYVMCVTRYMYGPLHTDTLKVLEQARSGRITYRFGMIALARLDNMRRADERRKLMRQFAQNEK